MIGMSIEVHWSILLNETKFAWYELQHPIADYLKGKILSQKFKSNEYMFKELTKLIFKGRELKLLGRENDLDLEFLIIDIGAAPIIEEHDSQTGGVNNG